MKMEAEVSIKSPRAEVWKVITDIDHAAERISGIIELEVLERPAEGLVGLKWRETREMFGKTATEEMWITEAVENGFYKTRAESHGSVYTAILAVSDEADGTLLRMSFDAQPQTMGAKVLSFLLGFMFKGATRKAIQQDPEDIKAAVEASS